MKQQLTTLIARGITYLVAILLTALVTKGIFSTELADQLTAEAQTAILGGSAFIAAVLMAFGEWLVRMILPTRTKGGSGAGSGGSLMPLLLLCGVAAVLLPSCGDMTGGFFYRDPKTGAKAGLKFEDGKGSYFGRVPRYDPETGELLGYGEISGPLAREVKPEK
jgi:hypothetical protein